MQEPLEKQKFGGPDSKVISNFVDVQDGDCLHPYSQSIIEMSPIRQFQNQQKKLVGIGTMGLNMIQDEQSTLTKPEFIRLIIGKRLQSNFINNLWNRSYLRKLHQLTKYQRETLDDLGFEINQIEQQNRDVFTPYSKVIFIWDFFQILLYLFIFFWIPFKLSFNMESIDQLWDQENNSHVFEILILMILVFDALVGMNLAFMNQGLIIRIIANIMHSLIWYFCLIILVSLVVLAVQFFIHEEKEPTSSVQLICGIVFYLLRLNKIDKILASIHEFFNLNGQVNDGLELVQVITIIIYIIHICACVWNYVGQMGYSNNWLDYYGYSSSPIYSRYNIAVYWATMTMTTVGYGDVTPKNDIETLINNITMLIGSIVFAYSVNSIGIFVSNIYKSRQEYNRSVTILNSYMSRNKVSFNLQTRIRSYLKYIWTEEKQMNEEEVGSIVNKLSSHLQEELDFQLKGNILSKCKVIAKTFSLKFQRQLLFSMEELSFSPEERIISINQIDDCSLYIIMKGEIELTFEGINQNGETLKRNSIQRLRTGDYFGEISFFTEQPRSASAIARGFVRVYKIKRENLLKLLHQYPNDKEKYCSLRDRLIMKESVPLAIQCYSCHSTSHLIHECHILHFCPDKEAIIKRELFPIEQVRRLRFRKKYSCKIHPWLTSSLLSRQAKIFTSQHIQFTKEEENIDENEEEIFDNQYDDDIGSDISPGKVRDKSQSVTQNLLDIEDDDKLMNSQLKNLLVQHQNVKTAGFIQEKQDRLQIENQSPELKARPSQSKINAVEKQVNFNIGGKGNEENLGSQQLLRLQSKKKSMTNQKTKEVSQLSDGFGMVRMTFQDTFDKLMLFNYYFPLNNYDVILKRYQRLQKTFGKKKIFPETSNYSFFILTIKKGFKLRKLADDVSNNPLQKNTAAHRKSHRKSKITQFFPNMNNNIND